MRKTITLDFETPTSGRFETVEVPTKEDPPELVPVPPWGGWGAESAGGHRDGEYQEIEVTTLQDGPTHLEPVPGSLRAALAVEGPTVVRFAEGLEGYLHLRAAVQMTSRTTLIGNSRVVITDQGLVAGGAEDLILHNVVLRTGTALAGGYVEKFRRDSGSWVSREPNITWMSNRAHVAAVRVFSEDEQEYELRRAEFNVLQEGEYFLEQEGPPHKRLRGLWVRLRNDADPSGLVILAKNKSLMPDPLTLTNCKRVLLSHCSLECGTDITLQMDACQDVSVWRCILADALDWPHGPKRKHSRICLVKHDQGDKPSARVHFHECAFLHAVARGPKFAGTESCGLSNCFVGDFRLKAPDFEYRGTDQGTGYMVGCVVAYSPQTKDGPRIAIEPSADAAVYLGDGNEWPANKVGGKLRPVPWGADREDGYLLNATDNVFAHLPELRPEKKLKAPKPMPSTLPVRSAEDLEQYLATVVGPEEPDDYDRALLAELVDWPNETRVKTNWRPEHDAQRDANDLDGSNPGGGGGGGERVREHV